MAVGAVALAGPLVAVLLYHRGQDVRGTVCQPVKPSPAVTDLGRPVEVALPATAEVPPAMLQVEDDQFRELCLSRRAIQMAPATAAYNCHGWVFGGGRYLISDEMAEMILRDNGYRPVSATGPGDLVVYFNPNGRVTHTGIVRVVTPDGLMLVESKWGANGRYLHRPEDQAYGAPWVFYRSARAGHRLRGLEGEAYDEPSSLATGNGAGLAENAEH